MENVCILYSIHGFSVEKQRIRVKMVLKKREENQKKEEICYSNKEEMQIVQKWRDL